MCGWQRLSQRKPTSWRSIGSSPVVRQPEQHFRLSKKVLHDTISGLWRSNLPVHTSHRWIKSRKRVLALYWLCNPLLPLCYCLNFISFSKWKYLGMYAFFKINYLVDNCRDLILHILPFYLLIYHPSRKVAAQSESKAMLQHFYK